MITKRCLLIKYVRANHKGQFRKYTEKPYFNHCREVCVLSGSMIVDHKLAWEVGICHDLFEDTACTPDRLTKRLISFRYSQDEADTIVEAVSHLTDYYIPRIYPELNRKQRKEREAKRFGDANTLAQSVKCADIIDNTKSIVKHDKKFAEIYLPEIVAMLDNMRRAEIGIYIEVCYTVRIALKELKDWQRERDNGKAEDKS